jgi:hypothetical protein
LTMTDTATITPAQQRVRDLVNKMDATKRNNIIADIQADYRTTGGKSGRSIMNQYSLNGAQFGYLKTLALQNFDGVTTTRRGRGRPRKSAVSTPIASTATTSSTTTRRARGRPRGSAANTSTPVVSRRANASIAGRAWKANIIIGQVKSVTVHASNGNDAMRQLYAMPGVVEVANLEMSGGNFFGSNWSSSSGSSGSTSATSTRRRARASTGRRRSRSSS